MLNALRFADINRRSFRRGEFDAIVKRLVEDQNRCVAGRKAPGDAVVFSNVDLSVTVRCVAGRKAPGDAVVFSNVDLSVTGSLFFLMLTLNDIGTSSQCTS